MYNKDLVDVAQLLRNHTVIDKKFYQGCRQMKNCLRRIKNLLSKLIYI